MDIIGSGMIARSLAPYASEFSDTVAFACGVASSTEVTQEARDREYSALYGTLERCLWDGKRFVYFSSGAVYGTSSYAWREDAATYPRTPYGQHKLLCEAIIRNSGVPYLIARLGNLVGVGQNPAQLIPSLVRQAEAGWMTVQINATRDLMDVQDMALLLIDLLRTQAERCEILNVASGQSISAYNIALKLRLEMELDAPIDKSEGGDPQGFSVERLHERLPLLAWIDSGYYRRVLKKYIGAGITENAS